MNFSTEDWHDGTHKKIDDSGATNRRGVCSG
jgi:hypothetical protein